jgi:type IV pilus assembly protein PilY1
MNKLFLDKLLMRTHKPRTQRRLLARAFAVLVACNSLSALAAVPIVQSPLSTPNEVPNNMVLIPSVEWPTVVTQAYDPGIVETSANYSNIKSYQGYFNPDLCYAYHYETTEANRYFYPAAAAATSHNCSGLTGGTPPDPINQRLWSGNFINWAAIQAIDVFRLALTGGYRVNRPAEGVPAAVNSLATGDQVTTTYLEKANSDRWNDTYTRLRRLASSAGNSTPTQTTTIRTRIGGLRSQMWFIPDSSLSLGSADNASSGSANGYAPVNAALTLPVTDGSQTRGAATAIPYNPSYHALPNSTTSTTTNGSACGAGEPGCTINATCPNGGTLSGSTCGAQSVAACPTTGNKYFWTSDKKCHQNLSPTAGTSQTAATVCTVSGAVIPSNNTTGQSCNLAAYAATITNYTHTTYGRDQIYAVSVRVKVCDGTLDTRSDLCVRYGSNYKPEGLLQHNSAKTRYSLFSYLTEHGHFRQGGVMRARQKLIGPVITGEQPYPAGHLPDDSATGTTATTTARIAGVDNPEWSLGTGQIINDPDSTDSSATTSRVAAGTGSCTSTDTPDSSSCVIQYSGVINYLNRFGQIQTGKTDLKQDDNLSEMYYTALRYLRGLSNPSSFSSFSGTKVANYQNADGFPVIEDWYGTNPNTENDLWTALPKQTVGKKKDPMLYQCQATVMLGIGDTATQSEEDDYSSDVAGSGYPGAASTGFVPISKSDMQLWRGYTEAGSTAAKFDLAGLAYWAHLNDLRLDIDNPEIGGDSSHTRGQVISTYLVDVVERADFLLKGTNQYYNATKFGGYNFLDTDFTSAGNVTRPNSAWFVSNKSNWTNAANFINFGTTGFTGGSDYYQPSNMFLGNNGTQMVAGLNAAFSKIAADVVGSGASLAANSTQLGTGTTTYQATYYTGDWHGDLVAYRVCTGDTSVPGCATQPSGAIAATSAWRASVQIPTPANRDVYTCTGTCIGQTNAVQFTTQATSTLTLSPSLDSTTANNLCMNPGSCATGEQTNLVNYLLGTNVTTLRSRTITKLGDIVNSQPVYVGHPSANQYVGKTFASAFATYAENNAIKNRDNTIYVAANDGMLHAFYECTFNSSGACTSSTTPQGQEIYAYLPRAVIRNGLPKYAQPSYGTAANPHQFFNDGELTVMEIECASTACPNAVGGWATVLIGSTGRGTAKAVYALDVTDPTDISLLWERSAGDGSALDANSGYIGQTAGKPVVARLSDGSWVALMGNGYNSPQNVPALLQFNIATGRLSVYTTTGSTNDGLAPPAVWIGNASLSSNVSTEAYAGDLNGNVWQFTLNPTPGSATKIYIATTSSSAVQPITARIAITKNPVDNKVWIYFGTGSVLSTFQSSDGQENTWYGLIVQGTDAVSSSSSRSDLMQRTIAAENAATGTSLAVRGISLATANDMSGESGWYIDLESPSGAQGERMVTPNQFQGSVLLGVSRIPSSSNTDPCNPSGGSGWIMAVNPFTGTPTGSNSFFDANRDGNFHNDVATSGSIQYVAAGVGYGSVANNPIFVGHDMLISFSDASTGSLPTSGTTGSLKRVSWREMLGL